MSTKEKVAGKGSKAKTAGTKKKPSSVICFVCGKTGHFARGCEQRKEGEHALHTNVEEDVEDDDESIEAAFITTDEVALFTRSHVLLDNQASVNIFCNSALLTDIKKSQNAILFKGVQSEAKDVRVEQEGDFGDIGPVYFSRGATANILSFAAMADSGAEISYDHEGGCFTLRPAGSKTKYHFSRQDLPGGKILCMGREQRGNTGASIGDDCSRQHGPVHETRGCIDSSSQRDASSDGLSNSRDGYRNDQGWKQLQRL